MLHHKNELIGIMTVQVDDFLCAGTELFYKNVIHKFWETFSVGKEENCSFKYLGLNIKVGKNQINVD